MKTSFERDSVCSWCCREKNACECGEYVIPFGRYDGWTLAEVWVQDPEYLRYVRDKFKFCRLKKMTMSYLKRVDPDNIPVKPKE